MLRPTALDDLVNPWDWRAGSTILVGASAGEVAVAFEQVSLRELPDVGGAAAPPTCGDRSGLTLLQDLLDQGYFLLYEEPERELVLGRVGRFWRPGASSVAVVTGRRTFVAFSEPGYAKAAIALQIQPATSPEGAEPMCLVAVELRVCATDAATRHDVSRRQPLGPWASPAGRSQLLRALRRRASDRAARS